MLRQIPRVARVATERAAASRELLLACAARLQPAPGVAAASQEIKVASASAAASSVAEVAGLGSRALQSAYSLASHPYSPSAWRTASPSAIASALATHRSGAASRLLQTASSASAYSSAVSVSPQELQALAQYRRAFATTTASLSEALRVEPVRKLRPDESDSSIWHTEGEPAPSPSAAAAAAAASGVEGTVAVGEPGAGSTSSVSGMAVGAIDPRMVIAFTCTNCDTHLVKTMSKKSYTQGVVLVRCDGCKSHHLIADHLGWFDDHGVTIEDIMREKGEAVTRADADSQLSQDLLARLQQTVQQARPDDLSAPLSGVQGMRMRDAAAAAAETGAAEAAGADKAAATPEAEVVGSSNGSSSSGSKGGGKSGGI